KGNVGGEAANDPKTPIGPVAGIIQPSAVAVDEIERINSIIKHPCQVMVFARVIARRHNTNGIIRPVKMARGGADKMLVHTLDAHLSVIAIGIAAGTTEDGVVEVHSICEIKILRLPEIDNWRDANPGRSEEHTSELQSRSELV